MSTKCLQHDEQTPPSQSNNEEPESSEHEDSSSDSSPASMSETLEHLEEKGEENNGKKVSLEELLESLGQKSFGPMLLLPALITLMPVIGGIPGLPFITASWIILVAGQMLLGRKHFWFPQRLLKLKVDSDKLQHSVQSVTPWVRWIETFIRPRLAWLCRGPARYFTAVVVIVLALTMYPLELIPFGVSFPALALCIFALGITAHDGVLVITGWVLSFVSLFVACKMFL